MNDHETVSCEHGRQISTCRCPSENKAIRVTPNCPFGCDSAGVTALSFRDLLALKYFLMGEAADSLPPVARKALQLQVRLDADARAQRSRELTAERSAD